MSVAQEYNVSENDSSIIPAARNDRPDLFRFLSITFIVWQRCVLNCFNSAKIANNFNYTISTTIIIAGYYWPYNPLLTIADLAPTTKEELLTIKGLGKSKCDKYGDEILDVIRTAKK